MIINPSMAHRQLLFTLRVPKPDDWLTLNAQGYMNRWVKRRIVNSWKEMAKIQILRQHIPKSCPPATIRPILHVVSARGRDPGNWTATVKPIVDELVRYGCWRDDRPEFVEELMPEFKVIGKGANPGVVLEVYAR